MRRAALCALTAAALLAGCATAQRPDPLEPLNRKVFAFNEAVDSAVLKPTAEVYRAVLPTPAQIAVSNFFGNLKDAWSAVNLLLQGRVADSLSDVMRVGTNTVFGFMGVTDVTIVRAEGVAMGPDAKAAAMEAAKAQIEQAQAVAA